MRNEYSSGSRPGDQDDDGPLATPTDAAHEYALNVGREHPESAWILTPYDSWEPNPFYSGPPVRHPEDDAEPGDAGRQS